MATNTKKAKSKDLNDKKSAKRSEDATPSDEKKHEATKSVTDCETPADEEKCESVLPQEETPVVEVSPSPEPVYEEPVLPQLIVEKYEGEKDKGEYAGMGVAKFKMGHNYEGQFVQGLMHGVGTYTWADGLIYEGEFTQNKVTGKGLYKWPDGSMYDGDVQDGLRHGFGTFVSANKHLSFTGEWHEGKRHGKGRMNYDSEGKSYYEGDWVNNKKHGWGIRCYPSGNIYQGCWFNDVRHGEGTMRWIDRDQMYTGQWQLGIQDGTGEHIWFLKRVGGSQYPLRNMYDGDFVQGMRQGQGTFYYANGARYEGEWKNNMKHGKGKFVFKNGRVYEGVFEKDHILEFPDFQMDGMNTPDITMIRTRTPLPSAQPSNDSHNTHSPSFQLDVEHLLSKFPDNDRDFEAAQVIYVIMGHMTALRKIYNYYSALGYEESPDNTFVMNKMQMWRFLKDCHLHHLGSTLADMDRVLAKPDGKVKPEDIHSPYSKVLFREFLNHLVSLAYHLYSSEYKEGSEPLLAWCMSRLISENIQKYSCSVKGYIYQEARRAINVLIHLEQAYEVFKSMSMPAKPEPDSTALFRKPPKHPNEPTLKMRQFLLMLQDLRLINTMLTAKKVIEILAVDDPGVIDSDGATVNLELEMVFEEFLEALVGCAEVYVTEAVVKDPNTPRPSTCQTQPPVHPPTNTHSAMSSSHGGADSSQNEEEEEDGASQHSGAIGEWETPPRSATSQFTAPSHPTPGSAGAKKSDVLVQKKSESFVSSRATQHIVQSMVSMPVDTEQDGDVEEDEDEEEEDNFEELDENTRQFNFWTHKVHIFFVRKFFPAAHRYAVLRELVNKRS